MFNVYLFIKTEILNRERSREWSNHLTMWSPFIPSIEKSSFQQSQTRNSFRVKHNVLANERFSNCRLHFKQRSSEEQQQRWLWQGVAGVESGWGLMWIIKYFLCCTEIDDYVENTCSTARITLMRHSALCARARVHTHTHTHNSKVEKQRNCIMNVDSISVLSYLVLFLSHSSSPSNSLSLSSLSLPLPLITTFYYFFPSIM